MSQTNTRPQWSSRWTFILATTGSAIGLGNIWKFPYIMGEQGGAAFVVVYLASILFIAMPIMMAEIMLGRRGKANPITAMSRLVEESDASSIWKLIGWLGVAAGAIILSYYSVIAGWVIEYVRLTGLGGLTSLSSGEISTQFTDLLADPMTMLLWHTIFIVATVVIVARGVSGGLELATKLLMPVLIVLLLVLLGYSIAKADFAAGLNFMFAFEPSKITYEVVLSAVGHSFFTLSLGMGAVMVYGSYLSPNTSLLQVSLAVVAADTIIAILAGLVIFPIVFSFSLEPGVGPGLLFITLPTAFSQMIGGAFWGTLFFVLILFAAWTSAISLTEPVAAWVQEKFSTTKTVAACVVGFIIWLLGIATVFSFNDWAFSFNFLGVEKSDGLFDVFDILTSNIMLPLGGVLIALFAGWGMKRTISTQELQLPDSWYNLWYFLVRFVSPVAVIIVLLFLLFGPLFSGD